MHNAGGRTDSAAVMNNGITHVNQLVTSNSPSSLDSMMCNTRATDQSMPAIYAEEIDKSIVTPMEVDICTKRGTRSRHQGSTEESAAASMRSDTSKKRKKV